MLDFDALREAIKTGKKTIYSDNRTNTPFFNLYKDEGWNKGEKQFEAEIRLVVKPGTKGFGYRVMHPSVGYPGKDPKSFVCPRWLAEFVAKQEGKEADREVDCILCRVVALAKDEDLQKATIPFVVRKDNIPVTKEVPVAEVIKKIEAEHRLIFVVCEPRFMNDEDAKPDLRGLQTWFVTKRTLVARIMTMMKNFPPDHFTSPERGTSIFVSFSPGAPALEMYNVMPYQRVPLDPELVKTAPDAEQFTSKVQTEDRMYEKLKEMLPGVDL